VGNREVKAECANLSREDEKEIREKESTFPKSQNSWGLKACEKVGGGGF